MKNVLIYPTFRCGQKCGYCLAARTKIRLAGGGSKEIHNLKVGDELYTLDENNERAVTKVTEVMSRFVKEVYRISFRSGSKITTTGEHPFKVGLEWVEVKDLKIGDEVIKPNALINHCLKCGKELGDGKAKFCSHFCSGSYNMRFQPKDFHSAGGKAGVKSQIETYGRLPFATHTNREPQRIMAKKRMTENNPMKNPEIAHKVFRTFVKNHPKFQKTKMEKWFEENVAHELPIHYVGDGRLFIANHNPDFKVDDQQKVIEISKYGYMNRDESYINKMNTYYLEHGFKSITFLFKRINAEEATIARKELIQFINNGDEIISITRKILPPSLRKKVYNINCEPYPWYIAEGVLVHNCAWSIQPDGKSVKHRCSDTSYIVEKELTAEQLIELLKPIDDLTIYEFTGGEPLRFSGINEVFKVLPNWLITSNTLSNIDDLDLTNCRGWQASFHPDVNDSAKEKFFQNINKIKSLGIKVGITLVAQPETTDRTIDWLNIFLKANFDGVIHLYHEDPLFEWNKYPKELEKLVATGHVVYGKMFYNWNTEAEKKLCRGGKDYIVIAPDGKKFRCVIDMILSRKPIEKPFEEYQECFDSCPMGCDHARGGIGY